MSPIVAALINAGPALIRLFGKSKGGKTEAIAEGLADTVAAAQGLPGNKQQKLVENGLQALSPAEQLEFKVSLEQIKADMQANQLQHDQAMHAQQQQTIRTSADLAGVRPSIANRHSWFTCAYFVAAELAKLAGYGSGASMEIGLAIAAPTLAWFGFRTWDKFTGSKFNQKGSKD